METETKKIDLIELRDDMERIAGDWNGDDDQFSSGGILYTADAAECAGDIAEKCRQILGLLEEMSEYGKSID